MTFKKADWFWFVIAFGCLFSGDPNGGEPQSFIFYAGLLIVVMAGVFLVIQGITATVDAAGNKLYKSMPVEDQKAYRGYIESRGRAPIWGRDNGDS